LLLDDDAGDVGHDGIGQALETELAGGGKHDQRILHTLESVGHCRFNVCASIGRVFPVFANRFARTKNGVPLLVVGRLDQRRGIGRLDGSLGDGCRRIGIGVLFFELEDALIECQLNAPGLDGLEHFQCVLTQKINLDFG
jgi:hypothetical protein